MVNNLFASPSAQSWLRPNITYILHKQIIDSTGDGLVAVCLVSIKSFGPTMGSRAVFYKLYHDGWL